MNKTIDTLVIGNNITSFLTSSQILKSGQKAIYLRDKRIKSSDPYFMFFGPLDLSFIKTWVSDLEMAEDIFNEDSFVLSPFSIIINGKRTMCAGASPYLNFMQVCRHYPSLHNKFLQILASEDVDHAKFDSDFLACAKRLGESFCRYKTIHQISVSTFKADLPKYIYDIYTVFKEEVKNNRELHQFICTLRCVYTHGLELTLSDLELMYYFISVLSPRYHFLWSPAKETQVNETINSLGGSTYDDIIEEFSFSNNRPWATQLSSFSGVISPAKIAIFSSNVAKLGISHNLESLYRCIKLRFKCQDDLVSGIYYIFNDDSFGGDIAFIRKEVIVVDSLDGKQTLANIKVYKKYNDCLKLDFCQDELEAMLKESHIIEKDDQLMTGVMTDEVCVLRNHGMINSGAKINLKFRNSDGPKASCVKGVYYQGPLKKNELAITQTLIEAREFKTFI